MRPDESRALLASLAQRLPADAEAYVDSALLGTLSEPVVVVRRRFPATRDGLYVVRDRTDLSDLLTSLRLDEGELALGTSPLPHRREARATATIR